MPASDPSRLFNILAADFSRYLQEQKSQIERDLLTFPATEQARLGQVLFSSLAEGGFCTHVVRGRTAWDPRSHYYQAARFAARRGRRIRRAFLLPHRHYRHDPTLREHVALDKEAAIDTTVLYIGDLLATSALPLTGSLDFAIWDRAIACVGIPASAGQGTLAELRITSRPEDLQSLSDIQRLLQKKAPVIDLSASAPTLDLEEPMITTAPIAHELAAVLCQGDHVSPEDCSWYHAVWQYLRVFNMVSTPTRHTRFYLRSLETLANSGDGSQILISGTADYSMLAHILWAYRASGVRPEITVLDLCETPLFLCNWYAKSVGTRVTTVAADILSFESERPFDLVATDAFLTRFPKGVRPTVMARWHKLVRPGGHVVTTARIEEGSSRPTIQATPERADAFRRRALQEARRWQDFLACPPDRVANLAQRYAERMTSHSFGSREEIECLFDDAGFAIEQLAIEQVPGEMSSTLYGQVVARRQ
jgi:hypothetical protein